MSRASSIERGLSVRSWSHADRYTLRFVFSDGRTGTITRATSDEVWRDFYSIRAERPASAVTSPETAP